MAADSSWTAQPTQDKLDIFVSSRLQECKEERTAAREAIRGINHNAVLFEHIGARSDKPRQLYLSRLRDSQLLVAIHRLGYGYVDAASGMEISGLEDEFVFARDHGIPILLYVFEDATGRDERLAKLIKQASANVTIWFYRTPQELEARIRDDLTAEITRFVLRPDVARGVLEESPSDLLERASRRQGTLVDRTKILAEIAASSESHPALCVYGRAGIGKTTLAAQFADRESGTYARVTGLAPLDIFTVTARAITDQTGPGFSTLQGALLAFSAAWAERDQVLLVVDECDFIPEVLHAIATGGGVSPSKRVVFTSRTLVAGMDGYEVPPLEADEVRQMFGARPIVEPLTKLDTPLEVQTQIALEGPDPAQTDPVVREAISYLALSPGPLSAAELLSLLGDDTLSIETLYQRLGTVGRLVDDSPSGFRIVHEETASRLRDAVLSTPQRARFYVTRLESAFEERGDFRLAYRVTSYLHDGSEDRHALAAIRQSSQLGDVRFGREVAEALLGAALDDERRADAFDLMLMLVYPLELMGEVARASSLLEHAESLSSNLGPEQRAFLAEVALSSRARRTLSENDVEGLEQVREEYVSKGARWDGARIGLELSALYVASKAFERAVEVLRPTLEEFELAGDEYGIDLAERNLASALAALQGNDAEVDVLVARIQARTAGTIDPRRQQAWHNNILSRRYRLAGRFEDAERVNRETISISRELGEESLTALTYINLGNVLRDREAFADALEAYATAGTLAQHCARRDIEADSSRLSAGLLNDNPQTNDIVTDRRERARAFAQHAIGLLTGTIYREALARSYVELAEAEEALGNSRNAALGYFNAAEQFPFVPDEEGFERALIFATETALDAEEIETYVNGLSRLFGASLNPDHAVGDKFLSLIEPILTHAPRDRLVRILGRHLRTVRDELPTLLRPVLLEEMGEAVSRLSHQLPTDQSWRVLFTSFFVPFLAQDSRGYDVHRRYSTALTHSVDGLGVRYTEHDDCVWTVVLELARPITITVLTMDNSPAVSAVSQALAVFFKAFEKEIGEIVGRSEVSEIALQVASYEEMPADLREVSQRMFRIEQLLTEQGSAVTRTDDFSGETPTMVFLASDFLANAVAGGGVSGSMQTLLGLTMIELVYQCFKGQVDEEEIRPKIVSLIRRTLS
jgi:tetratricopeptide (TPR) repeat protein